MTQTTDQPGRPTVQSPDEVMADLLATDPQMFIKVAAIGGETQEAATRVLARLLLDATPATTVRTYLAALGRSEDPGYEQKVGTIAARLFNAEYGCKPSQVPSRTQAGRRIEVYGYRGPDVRFLAEAVRQLTV
jgi:hypothetical protein